MKNNKRKVYNQDFKINAVKMLTVSGMKASDVARELEVSENLLYQWKQKYLENQEEAFPGNGKQNSREDYIRKLEQENKQLKDERDILKKAAIFFAKET